MKDEEQVVGVPVGAEALGADRGLAGGLALEHVQGGTVEAGEVFGSVTGMDPTGIVAEHHIKGPVQGVFHAPMAADRRGQSLRVIAGEAGDKVATFGGGLAAEGFPVWRTPGANTSISSATKS